MLLPHSVTHMKMNTEVGRTTSRFWQWDDPRSLTAVFLKGEFRPFNPPLLFVSSSRNPPRQNPVLLLSPVLQGSAAAEDMKQTAHRRAPEYKSFPRCFAVKSGFGALNFLDIGTLRAIFFRFHVFCKSLTQHVPLFGSDVRINFLFWLNG